MRKSQLSRTLFVFILFIATFTTSYSQINTDKVLAIGKNALYFEDYVLSIQYFNQVIKAKPYLAEPYLYRGLAKFYLDDYSGAERDLTTCIERNPFIWMAYQVRGACRQNNNNYQGAIEDYEKGMEFRPEDRHFLFNRAIAFAQLKDYDASLEAFEQVLKLHPRYVHGYLVKGSVLLEKGDTIQAMENFDKVLELDKYYSPGYERRAMLYFQQENYEKALEDIDEAIRLESKQPGYHINRGLIRYYLNDLRGAMADYDKVVQIDKNNLIARFNRGLLRATVGDMDGAVEDLDKVIELEPDNFIARYNRVIFNMELNKFSNAMTDLDSVLKEYPNFLQGYYLRSELNRKMGRLRDAEKDYWNAHDLEKRLTNLRAQGKTITGKEILDKGSDATTDAADDKVRESSDKNIDKFNRLVVYDKEEEAKSQYNSEIRGRVQDRQVKVDLEPQFVASYYESIEEIDRSITRTNKVISEYNRKQFLTMQLRLINHEVPLVDSQADHHFQSIDYYSLILHRDPENADAYFARGLDYMILQDFSEAIDNFSEAIRLNPEFVLAYFNRAITRYKEIEVENARQGNDKEHLDLTLNPQQKTLTQITSTTALNPVLPGNNTAAVLRYDLILQDYNKILELDPGFVYAYFNRANICFLQKEYRLAIANYSDAIQINPDFAEAYYNRGLTRLYLGDTDNGISDMSKAGELGLINAYSIIKKMAAD